MEVYKIQKQTQKGWVEIGRSWEATPGSRSEAVTIFQHVASKAKLPHRLILCPKGPVPLRNGASGWVPDVEVLSQTPDRR